MEFNNIFTTTIDMQPAIKLVHQLSSKILCQCHSSHKKEYLLYRLTNFNYFYQNYNAATWIVSVLCAISHYFALDNNCHPLLGCILQTS